MLLHSTQLNRFNKERLVGKAKVVPFLKPVAGARRWVFKMGLFNPAKITLTVSSKRMIWRSASGYLTGALKLTQKGRIFERCMYTTYKRAATNILCYIEDIAG